MTKQSSRCLQLSNNRFTRRNYLVVKTLLGLKTSQMLQEVWVHLTEQQEQVILYQSKQRLGQYLRIEMIIES